MSVLGLKRGTVKLIPHQKEWETNALNTIELLKRILGDIAIDIQHIGSTSISTIHAKPIIDIVIGVIDLNNIKSYIEILNKNNIIFRGEDVTNQLLFIMGDTSKDINTHHIHVVKWNEESWINYINFRDYLNAFKDKAFIYDNYKQKLAIEFPNNRKNYTEKKNELINRILKEAKEWKKVEKDKK